MWGSGVESWRQTLEGIARQSHVIFYRIPGYLIQNFKYFGGCLIFFLGGDSGAETMKQERMKVQRCNLCSMISQCLHTKF